MPIIVEVKNCCRKQKLDEGLIDSAVELFTSDAGFAERARTMMTKKLVEAMFEYLFGGFSEGAKATILYKTVVESVAALDTGDYVALFRGGTAKRPVCEKLAASTITGLLNVVNNEIIGELEMISQKFIGAKKGSFGTMLTGVLGSVATFVSGSMIEDLKAQGKLDPLADAICEIDLVDLLKRQFGDMSSFLKGLKNRFGE